MATKKPAESGIRADTFQTNFTAGEFSPLLEGRVGLAKYKDAVSKLENFYIKNLNQARIALKKLRLGM